MWLAYTAPHTPFHLPPDSLHSQGMLPSDAASIAANPQPYFMAMIEAMDSEMGRFINSMSQSEKDNTIIIFLEIMELQVKLYSNMLRKDQKDQCIKVE